MIISSKTIPVKELCEKQISEMFGIYSRYYGGTSRALFNEDLNKKDNVILIMEKSQKLQGFSAVGLTTTEFEGKSIKVLISGDTIVERKYWGKNDLAYAWLKHAGKIKQQEPHIPLYWFFLVNGHRTYRYLGLFCNAYYPAHERGIPKEIKGLMDQLSITMFGEHYDRQKGILHFPESRGYLLKEWADVPKKDLRHKEVQFFLKNNPGYRDGDDLVCLCELKHENLRPFIQRIFNQHEYQL